MSKTESKRPEAEDATAANDAGRNAEQPEPESEQAAASEKPDGDDDIQALRAELEAAQTKAQDNWEAYLRASAELENVRRRAERDVANAHKFGLEKFAAELLGVRDSLELGLESAKSDQATIEKVREGMTLTLKQLAGAMDKFGIRQINPAGMPFDPEQHEAVAMVPKADADPNTIVDVMQRGYILNDRLLRAAMVTVAKAPPEASPEPSGDDDENSN